MFILKKMLVLMLVILVSPFNSNTMAMFGPSLSKTPSNKRYAKVLIHPYHCECDPKLDLVLCLKINGHGNLAEQLLKQMKEKKEIDKVQSQKQVIEIYKMLNQPRNVSYYFDDNNEIIANFYSADGKINKYL